MGVTRSAGLLVFIFPATISYPSPVCAILREKWHYSDLQAVTILGNHTYIRVKGNFGTGTVDSFLIDALCLTQFFCKPKPSPKMILVKFCNNNIKRQFQHQKHEQYSTTEGFNISYLRFRSNRPNLDSTAMNCLGYFVYHC